MLAVGKTGLYDEEAARARGEKEFGKEWAMSVSCTMTPSKTTTDMFAADSQPKRYTRRTQGFHSWQGS